MKNLSKKIFFIIFILIFLGGGFWFLSQYRDQPSSDQAKLEELRIDYPELVSYVDDVIKAQEDFNNNPDDVTQYSHLGLAWKSLADQAKNLSLEETQVFYKEALEIYQAGVEATERKNTLLLINAGNMAQYLEDYDLAEELYKEAIFVSPGDWTYYVKLAELYEYQMNKSQEEILAVYEAGSEKVLDPKTIESRKDQYLKRSNQ